MNHIHYKNSKLFFNDININEVQLDHPTPFYLYDLDFLANNYSQFYNAAIENNINNPLVCFAMKSNANQTLLQKLIELGSGMDIVSVGELKRAIECGCPPQKIVFSGVGKTEYELDYALNCHPEGIYSFNIESIDELDLLKEVAIRSNKVARVAFRVNPNVQTKTHQKISTGDQIHKFGLQINDVEKLLKNYEFGPNLKVIGLSIHIGSQLTCLEATKTAILQLSSLALTLPSLEFLDVGGGLGIDYHHDKKIAPDFNDYMKTIYDSLQEHYYSKSQLKPRIVFEPGRCIIGNTGVFVTKVIRTKVIGDYHITIVDGGMNDFARPSLYEAHHQIYHQTKIENQTLLKTDIVGPICETTDTFAKNLDFPESEKGDVVLFADAGAYGHVMGSTYNLRPIAKEYIYSRGQLIRSN